MRNFLANLRDLAGAAAGELVAHLPGARITVTDETRRCAVPGHPHQATDGLLCREHLEELGTWLRDIQSEIKRLSAAPSLEIRWDRAVGGSLASEQSPAVLDPIVHTDPRSTAHGWQHVGPTCADTSCGHESCRLIRADADEHDARAERPLYALGVLHDLANRVREERMLKPPVRNVAVRVPGVLTWHRTVPAPPTVAGERDLLTRNLDWIAAQPWVIPMREQLAELRAQLQRTNRNQDERPLRGWCPRPGDDKGAECGGELLPEYPPAYATSSAGVDESPWRPRAVACSRNPSHRWEGPRELARLSWILEEQQRREDDEAEPGPRPRSTAAASTSAGVTPLDRLRPVLTEQKDRDDAAGPVPW